MTREEAIAYLEDPFPLSNSLSIERRLELHDKALRMAIEALKAQSSQPEPHYDEWCTDCKEYDHERHCCPRWNRVIRETLKDAQPNTDHIYAELSTVYNVKGLPDEAIGIIGDLMLSLDGPSAQPEQRWIPCSERLPENEYVLISKIPSKILGDKWSVDIATRIADPRSGKIQWRDSGFGVIEDDKVLAWMTLPAAYKGKSEQDERTNLIAQTAVHT